jgi:anthranilate synthase component 2
LKILLLDNYDSFTYNLLHLAEQIDGVEIEVFRNDEIGVEETDRFDRIIISPGPGLPSEAGQTTAVITRQLYRKHMLGVCLGMQAIAEVCGGKLKNLPQVLHGISSLATIIVKDEKLFYGFPENFKVGHYHSWCVDRSGLPAEFRETARGEDGLLLSFTHENGLARGVQFHPESILTEFGKELMFNWLFRCK